jgi:hypothetical protein
VQAAAQEREAMVAGLQQELEEHGRRAAEAASSLRQETEAQRFALADLQQQNGQLEARAETAEARAREAAGQLAAACEQNAVLAEQLAQLQGQVRGFVGVWTARCPHLYRPLWPSARMLMVNANLREPALNSRCLCHAAGGGGRRRGGPQAC